LPRTTQKSEIDVDNHEILQKVIMFYEHRSRFLLKGGMVQQSLRSAGGAGNILNQKIVFRGIKHFMILGQAN
jgi:hypothetical protein